MSEAALAAILSAICFVESGNRIDALHVGDGEGTSYGQCQIKLKTARFLGYRGGPSDLWVNPEVNRYWAKQYLLYQYRRYGSWEKAISAYNAGSVRGGQIRNTQYVSSVLRAWREGR